MKKMPWSAYVLAMVWLMPGLSPAQFGAKTEGLAAGTSIELTTQGPHRFTLVTGEKCVPTKVLLWYASCVVPGTLEVRESGAGSPIQRIALGSVRLYKLVPSYQRAGYIRDHRDWEPQIAEAADLDFDGNPDLLLSFDEPRNFLDRRTVAYVWDPNAKRYFFHEGISALAGKAWLVADTQSRRLIVKERAGPEDPMVDTEYRLQDGKPVPVRQTTSQVRADYSATGVIESEWRGGAWVQIATRQEAPPPLPPAPAPAPAPAAPRIK